MATHASSPGDSAMQPASLALPEIVWDIALLDLSYSDLLNLALCCTATFELLKPQLRAFHYSMDASKALPTYASAPLIRHLRHSVKHAAYAGEQEVALRAALARASGVRSFVLHGSSWGSIADFPKLWKTVRDASWRSLRNVEVVTLDRYAVFEGEPQMLPASEVRRFVCYGRSPDEDHIPRPYSLSLTKGLQAMTQLTCLRLGTFSRVGSAGRHTLIDELLAGANWPNLETLELAFHVGVNPKIVAAFLERHPRLHTLSLAQLHATDINLVPLTNVTRSALPSLRRFAGGWSNGISVLQLAEPKLECLGGPIGLDDMLHNRAADILWSEDAEAEAFLAGLAAQPTLWELDAICAFGIRMPDMRRLFEAAPKLRRLRLSGFASGSLDGWLKVFAQLPDLEELSFPLHELSIPISESSSSAPLHLRAGASLADTLELKRRVQMLVKACPKLKSVEFALGGAMPSAVVHRAPGSGEVREISITSNLPTWMRSGDYDVRTARSLVSMY